ncbi:hypothetical protein AVEN_175587-1 [Araneus ventricosus]|uniref:Uncharacterized protein n=1 Tax=Araneus ventricosus TaxID=182803 RepID=A0A4Y2T0R5_ARAVE|nr:hypothetical protein AVEN_175587-1 [Araneus ventricosus]
MRIVDGIRISFWCVRNVEDVTRKEIEDPAFINECVEKNLAFLKSPPNSSPPIFHTLVFQRNERELRVTSRNERESLVTCFEATRKLFWDELRNLNNGQMTSTTPELAPPLKYFRKQRCRRLTWLQNTLGSFPEDFQ